MSRSGADRAVPTKKPPARVGRSIQGAGLLGARPAWTRHQSTIACRRTLASHREAQAFARSRPRWTSPVSPGQARRPEGRAARPFSARPLSRGSDALARTAPRRGGGEIWTAHAFQRARDDSHSIPVRRLRHKPRSSSRGGDISGSTEPKSSRSPRSVYSDRALGSRRPTGRSPRSRYRPRRFGHAGEEARAARDGEGGGFTYAYPRVLTRWDAISRHYGLNSAGISKGWPSIMAVAAPAWDLAEADDGFPLTWPAGPRGTGLRDRDERLRHHDIDDGPSRACSSSTASRVPSRAMG